MFLIANNYSDRKENRHLNCKHSPFSVLLNNTVVDPGFPVGGGTNLIRGAPTLDAPTFPQFFFMSKQKILNL